LLQFIGLRHQFGSTILFDDFQWHIKPNSKIGLIGPNGSGKTTLFQIAVGRLKPDSGEVVKSKYTEISLFQQIPSFEPTKSVIETILISNKFFTEYITKKSNLEKEFDLIDHHSPEYEKILIKQSELEDFAIKNEVHELKNKAEQVLSGLGFSKQAMTQPVSSFSLGFQHRLALTIALLNPHNLLLLDEPTNHLDDASKLWLAEYLQSTKSSFILVTHDPEFLNATVTTIAEISPKGVTEFCGSLEEFLEEKNEVHEKLKSQFQKEEAYIQKRMEWINKFRAKATKARQAQSALKKLEKRKKLENPNEIFWNKKLEYKFRYTSGGKISFKLENASFGYTLHGKKIFEKANLEVSNGDKIALVGPNGAGKSTLLKCILGQYQLLEGNIYYGPKTKFGYFSQTHHEELDKTKNLVEVILQKYPNISGESARNILGHFSFSGDKAFKYIENLSGGEQSRLRLALLVFEETNCLLLDEPTNHLDMVTREALKSALINYEGSILIVSHDPDFLKGLCFKTFQLSNGILRDLNCSFEDYVVFHKEDTFASKSITVAKSSASEEYQKRNSEKNKFRKLQKEIESLEIQILNLEKIKKDLEEKFNDPKFYVSQNYQEDLNSYEEVKNQLHEVTEKWIYLSEQIGSISKQES
jgi:ATP-binding cassette subfamily F protein 3